MSKWPNAEWLRRAAEAEDECPAVSVGGLAVDLGLYTALDGDPNGPISVNGSADVVVVGQGKDTVVIHAKSVAAFVDAVVRAAGPAWRDSRDAEITRLRQMVKDSCRAMVLPDLGPEEDEL